MDKKVIVYSTNWCGYCSAEKDWLEHNKIEFVEKNVEEDLEAQKELFQKMGPSYMGGVPVTDVDGEMVLGFDRERLRNLLGISKF